MGPHKANDVNYRSLNMLVISTHLPYPPDSGGLVRLFNLYSRLGKKHRLTWVCPTWPGTEGHVQGANRFCERVVELPGDEYRPLPSHGWRSLLRRVVAHLHWERLFVFCFGYVQAPGLYWLPATPARLSLIDEIISLSSFDLIVCEFEVTAELAPVNVNVPKVITLHNMRSALFKRIRRMYDSSWEDRLFFWPEFFKIVWNEKRHYSRYNLAITVSEADERRLKRRCPSLPVEVLPNGVDLSYFRVAPNSGTSRSLVYVGHYGYPPNADAILHFSRRILPLIRERVADVQVLAVGHEPPEELSKHDGVQIIGSVPDVRPYLAQAGVVIVPLRVGGGTRLKILEALAMGKAVVSTTLGAEGLEVIHGHDILLADEPAEFAECVVRLLEQPDLRARLGRNGRRLVEQAYGWDALAAKLDKVFQRVGNDHRAAQTTKRVEHAVLSRVNDAQG